MRVYDDVKGGKKTFLITFENSRWIVSETGHPFNMTQLSFVSLLFLFSDFASILN